MNNDYMDKLRAFVRDWDVGTVAPAYIKNAGERKAKEYLIYLLNKLDDCSSSDTEAREMPSRKDLYGL